MLDFGSVVVHFGGAAIFRLIGAGEAVMVEIESYIRWWAPSYVFLVAMMVANAGFRAFHYGPSKNEREADFHQLRRRLAEGAGWNEELIEEIAPWVKGK